MKRPFLNRFDNIIYKRKKEKGEIVSVIINLLERFNHEILRVEPLHLANERWIVHLRFARKEDAGADRLRLRLAVRQDFQVWICCIRVSCKKKTTNVIILTREREREKQVRARYVFARAKIAVTIENRQKIPVSK